MFIKINTVKNGYQMKCVTLTQVKSPLVISDREPLKPGAGEAVVRLHAAAANRRDFWITRGMYPGIEPPVVLGSDGAGVVTACGTSSDEHWIDQEVVINPGVDWGENDCRGSHRACNAVVRETGSLELGASGCIAVGWRDRISCFVHKGIIERG
jgi:NADPH:quinone reductase-like Zn-dependent oxidoreductase